MTGPPSPNGQPEFVRERGYQPWHAPEPLPLIDDDDVTLVAWMAVEKPE